MTCFRVDLSARVYKVNGVLFVEAQSAEEALKQVEERIQDDQDDLIDADWEPDALEEVEVDLVIDMDKAHAEAMERFRAKYPNGFPQPSHYPDGAPKKASDV